jgi:hypothetical protein
VRYLSESFAVGALRRSASIEQFLGPAFHGGRRGIRWVAIEARRDGRYAVVLYLSRDVGGEDFGDLLEFPPLGLEADDAGEVLAEVDDAVEALALAERATDAVRERCGQLDETEAAQGGSDAGPIPGSTRHGQGSRR